MTAFARFSGVLALGVLCSSAASVQAQEPRIYSRTSCTKVKEGKDAEYAAYVKDVLAKLARVRVDAGVYDSYTIQQAVFPAGKAAVCDYRISIQFSGFPPEAASTRAMGDTAADLKKAGIDMSREAYIARRDELATLVDMRVAQSQERIGAVQKGSYARVNFWKVRPGMLSEWLRLLSTEFKPAVELSARENGTAWRVYTVVMPGGGGSSLAYNATSAIHFPTWAALDKGLDFRPMWNKVHPDRDYSEYLNQLRNVAELTRQDIYRNIEIIRK